MHKRSKIYKLLNWVFFICVNSEIFLRFNCIIFDEILENIEKFKVFFFRNYIEREILEILKYFKIHIWKIVRTKKIFSVFSTKCFDSYKNSEKKFNIN